VSGGAFFLVLAYVLGIVLVVLVVAIVGMVVFGKLGDAIKGLPRIRRSLAGRGLDRRVVDRIMSELEIGTGSMGAAVFAVVAGTIGLALGIYEVAGMWSPEPEELVLYPAPGAFVLLVGLVLAWRSRRVDLDVSVTHRALVTRGPRAVALVPTMIALNLDVTTTLDALAKTRVTRWTPVPHVVVVYDDQTEFAVRAFHDQDALAHELLGCLHALLPGARVEGFVPAWRAGGAPPPILRAERDRAA
jgi:hypothetical protein